MPSATWPKWLRWRKRRAHGPRFTLDCAVAARQVDAVPIGPNDVALDAIAIERGIIRRGKN